jgi:6-methylsalicylic acid synthase
VFVGDDTQLAGGLASRFAAAGVDTQRAATPESLAATLPGLPDGSAVIVIPPAGHPGEPVGDVATRSAWLLTSVAQQLAAHGPAAGTRLWCVTCGVRESADHAALGQAPLWGLGRVIASEHPEIWGGVVDLEAEHPDAAADSLLGMLAGRPDEDIVVVRDGIEMVPRLAALQDEATRPRLECRADGTYLITGGLGALGLEVAKWLASRGARRLVLVSRRGLPPREHWHEVTDAATLRQIESVQELEAAGVAVRALAMDITNRDEAAKMLSPDELGLTPVRGVVHAAGVLDNQMVRDVGRGSLRDVMRPKVEGAWVLHELFPPGSLDFLVLFSSCGMLLGLTGQASYACGNAFLDALASHRRAGGHTDTISFGWTSWRGLGMSTSSAVIDAELADRGTADISMTDAFACWELAERYDHGYFAVLRLIPEEPGAPRLPVLSELSAPGAQDGQEVSGESTAAWSQMSPAELRDYVDGEVRRAVAAEMKMAPADLDGRRPLAEMGLDSVMTLVIRRRLERLFRLRLPATLLWECPTAAAVARNLSERLIDDDDGGPVPDSAAAAPATAASPGNEQASVTGSPEITVG